MISLLQLECYYEEDLDSEDGVSRGLDLHSVMASQLSDAADDI